MNTITCNAIFIVATQEKNNQINMRCAARGERIHIRRETNKHVAMSFDRGQMRTNKGLSQKYTGGKKPINVRCAARGERIHAGRQGKKGTLRCNSATRGERCATNDLHLLNRDHKLKTSRRLERGSTECAAVMKPAGRGREGGPSGVI